MIVGPRLSIIPGRFVEDPRPGLNHYKVLNALGRYTDDEGWCRVKQGTIGEHVGLSRERVCRKLSDLVAWGYVAKHDEDGSGRAIWYRVLLDGGPPPTSAEPRKGPAAPAEPVTPASQVDTSNTSTCDATRHTRCDALGVTPGVTPAVTTVTTLLNDPSQRLSPPTPSPDTAAPRPPRQSRRRRAGAAQASSGATDWLDTLAAEGQSAAVVEHLLRPLANRGLRSWKNPDGGALDPVPIAAEVCRLLAGTEVAVLDEIARRIAETQRHRLPPVAGFLAAAAAARADYDRQRAEAEREAGLPIVGADPDLTSRFMAALATLDAGGQHRRAWFAAAGVRRQVPTPGGLRIEIVATSPPGQMERFATLAAPACRLAFGPAAVPAFVQGRVAA